MPVVPETVLERDAELAQLRAAVAGAAVGDGALVLVTGAPGIGKTALLRAGREAAAGAGFAVLGATASELDRGFPFGVVHQLLDGVMAGADPERRARLLAGTARHAEAVLGDQGAGGLGEDPGYLALHGLYWLVANLAEERPLALVVDDLHWADPPSVRLLEYLGRRLEGLSLVVVATTRPNEPGADAALLAELAGGPSALVLRPGPLGADAAHALVAGALGHAPEPRSPGRAWTPPAATPCCCARWPARPSSTACAAPRTRRGAWPPSAPAAWRPSSSAGSTCSARRRPRSRARRSSSATATGSTSSARSPGCPPTTRPPPPTASSPPTCSPPGRGTSCIPSCARRSPRRWRRPSATACTRSPPAG
jgi:hypothetical protein